MLCQEHHLSASAEEGQLLSHGHHLPQLLLLTETRSEGQAEGDVLGQRSHGAPRRQSSSFRWSYFESKLQSHGTDGPPSTPAQPLSKTDSRLPCQLPSTTIQTHSPYACTVFLPGNALFACKVSTTCMPSPMLWPACQSDAERSHRPRGT